MATEITHICDKCGYKEISKDTRTIKFWAKRTLEVAVMEDSIVSKSTVRLLCPKCVSDACVNNAERAWHGIGIIEKKRT